jgi:uncharacterized membrane protein YdjX (TVP38/TMEM64 family)
MKPKTNRFLSGRLNGFASEAAFAHSCSIPMRLLWLILALMLAIIVPFVIWGGDFEQWLTINGAAKVIREWGWLAVIVLLVADLFLPIPATPVMSAAGYVYGVVFGGLLSAAGSFLAGIVAYALCRSLGQRAAEWLAGRDALARGERLFAKRGAWLVALSRALPVLPEVVSSLAGLTRMPVRSFVLSLACGSLPMGFIYAGIGAAGVDRPVFALVLSAALPAVLWLFARWFLRTGSH